MGWNHRDKEGWLVRSWLWKPSCWLGQHEEKQAFVTEIFKNCCKNTWQISFSLRQATLFYHWSSLNLLLGNWCRGLKVRVVCLCVWEILQQTQSLENIYCKCSGPAKWFCCPFWNHTYTLSSRGAALFSLFSPQRDGIWGDCKYICYWHRNKCQATNSSILFKKTYFSPQWWNKACTIPLVWLRCTL